MTGQFEILHRLQRSAIAICAAIGLSLVPVSAGAGSKGGSVQMHGKFSAHPGGHSSKSSHSGRHGKRQFSKRSHRSGRKHYGSGSVSLSRSGVSLGTYGLQASGGTSHGYRGKHGRKGHREDTRGNRKQHYGQPAYSGHYYGGNRRSVRRVYKPSTRYYTSTGALIISVGGSYLAEEGATDPGFARGNATVLEKGCAPGEYCTLRLGDHYGAPKIITRNQTGKPIN